MKAILIGMAVMALVAISYLRGRSKLREVEQVDRHFTEKFQIEELLGSVSYQGGFPAIPRLTPLKVGLAGNSLVLYSLKGEAGSIPYRQIRKIEHFTTRTKANLKNKSVVFWGPFAPMIFKDKYRHFTLIKYTDIDNDENNLLLELKDSGTCREFSRQVSNSWSSFKKNSQ
ncbi:MAG TPA: hypothetical protein DCZ10_13870 [Pelotomaculum sp.]|nr:hypothetical protein [Pelotomaculum sp.]